MKEEKQNIQREDEKKRGKTKYIERSRKEKKKSTVKGNLYMKKKGRNYLSNSINRTLNWRKQHLQQIYIYI